MSQRPQILSPVRCVWPVAATLGEGTLWSQREQALYFVDILSHKLHRYTPATGERKTWEFDENITAVSERENAPGLIVALRRAIAYFDPETGLIEKLHEPEPEREGNRFNDGKCDAQGRFWAGSMDFGCTLATGALYRYDADGRCTRHVDEVHISNGPTWSADGRTLYFTETGKGEINAFDFDPETGTLSNRRIWLRFTDEDGGPDGMTTDAQGRIWIAHWGASRVTAHDPVTAEVLATVALPATQITNVAFGGPQLTTLYISSAADGFSAGQIAANSEGGLFEVETDAVGLPAGLFKG